MSRHQVAPSQNWWWRLRHRGFRVEAVVEDQPNPGSAEAVAAGCICAVFDNHGGESAPFPPDGWWITVGCPVHCPVEAEEPVNE